MVDHGCHQGRHRADLESRAGEATSVNLLSEPIPFVGRQRCELDLLVGTTTSQVGPTNSGNGRLDYFSRAKLLPPLHASPGLNS